MRRLCFACLLLFSAIGGGLLYGCNAAATDPAAWATFQASSPLSGDADGQAEPAVDLLQRLDDPVAGTLPQASGDRPISPLQQPAANGETETASGRATPTLLATATLSFTDVVTETTPLSATEAISDGAPTRSARPETPSTAGGLSPLATPPAARASLLPTPTPLPALPPAPAPGPTPDGGERSVQTPILMYHYLSVPPADANVYRQDLSVAPDLFAAQLDAMRDAGYSTISLYDLQNHLMQGAPLPPKPVVITFDDGYRDNYEHALPLLAERNMTATFFVVTDFMDEQRPEYLTWEMARAMLAAGMSIESHGRNHVSLAGKDTDYLVWQALGSRETIEYELGVQPRFVSYPAGDYDELTKAIFHSAGYWAGFTTAQGATHRSTDDLFELKRVRVRGTTSPEELIRLLELDW